MNCFSGVGIDKRDPHRRCNMLMNGIRPRIPGLHRQISSNVELSDAFELRFGSVCRYRVLCRAPAEEQSQNGEKDKAAFFHKDNALGILNRGAGDQ